MSYFIRRDKPDGRYLADFRGGQPVWTGEQREALRYGLWLDAEGQRMANHKDFILSRVVWDEEMPQLAARRGGA